MFRGYYIPDTTEKERSLTMNNIIADILKEYKDEIIAFASEVVKTRSLTCQEGEVASLIAGKMEELGYDEITASSASCAFPECYNGPRGP